MGKVRLILVFLSALVITHQILSVFWNSGSGGGVGIQSRKNMGVAVRSNSREESGLVKMPAGFAKATRKRRPFHTAVTATSAVYNQWQCRIMYYWYKRIKEEQPDGSHEMGGFTRVLHSGYPDHLMDEIPTFVVDPLPPGMDKGYVVLNRPWAFVQWLQKANIEEEYIFMAEPDHIILKPIPNLATEELPAAYSFFYITPKKHEEILRKFFKGPITNIDPIGNSPVIIKKSNLLNIAPTWANISVQMKNDPQTDKAFGWVLEMYGYAVASALHGVQHILQKNFMVQPPWDTKLTNTYIIHYTYGCDYTMKGELTYGKIGEWSFNKRDYTRMPVPRNLTLPPPGFPQTVVRLVEMLNEATSSFEDWTNWTSRVTQ